MKKLAIFVEGYTELLLVEQLILSMASHENVLIEFREIRGGSRARRTFGRIRATKPRTSQEYFIMLVDCGGDKLVKSRIIEEHENLTNGGYSKIIGLRDVRPDFSHADIPKLKNGMKTYIKTSLIPVEILLAILEVEAWFLAETKHFAKIDSSITLDKIVEKLNFNPSVDDMEQRLHPTEDLIQCYLLAEKTYSKGEAKTTVDALDFDDVYFHLPDKFPSLKRLIECLEEFLKS